MIRLVRCIDDRTLNLIPLTALHVSLFMKRTEEKEVTIMIPVPNKLQYNSNMNVVTFPLHVK